MNEVSHILAQIERGNPMISDKFRPFVRTKSAPSRTDQKRTSSYSQDDSQRPVRSWPSVARILLTWGAAERKAGVRHSWEGWRAPASSAATRGV